MVLPDGTVVTGKTSERLGAASSLLMNALKSVNGVDMELEVIADEAIEPISRLKTAQLGSRNPRLHPDETLIALSITSATSAVALVCSAACRSSGLRCILLGHHLSTDEALSRSSASMYAASPSTSAHVLPSIEACDRPIVPAGIVLISRDAHNF